MLGLAKKIKMFRLPHARNIKWGPGLIERASACQMFWAIRNSAFRLKGWGPPPPQPLSLIAPALFE